MGNEVIEFLKPEPGSVVVDGTIGEGGHSVLIARKILPDGALIGIDKDKKNIAVAKRRLSPIGADFKLFYNSYANIDKIIVEKAGIRYVDGILLDLGFSMKHIKSSKRGFSFLEDEMLDMRYDTDSGLPAHEWLNHASGDEIEKVLKEFGQEKEYRRIATAIVRYRDKEKIITAKQLAGIISNAKRKFAKKIHPATRTFQAIRIYMNNELEELEKGLVNSLKILKKGKRLAVLTYHSLEDRIVKDFLLKYSGRCLCPPRLPVCKCGAKERLPKVKILKESGLRPSDDEIALNPSARGAHLRGCKVE